MIFTQFLDGAIPTARKRASRLGVADQPLRHADRLKRVSREGIDDDEGLFLLHGATMPSFLTQVKPSDAGLRQNSWRGSLPDMALEDTPFGDIAERIRWHRTLLGMEQKEYAEKAGLQRSQLSNWETGATRLSLNGARALRITYGLSLDFMYEGIDDALSMTLRNAWRDRPQVNSSK
jgi:DNA-binding XRE family transcriptional regulator